MILWLASWSVRGKFGRGCSKESFSLMEITRTDVYDHEGGHYVVRLRTADYPPEYTAGKSEPKYTDKGTDNYRTANKESSIT